MCGIAGLFDLRERSIVDERVLARMTDVQAHRGPDGRGVFRGPGVGLGHRRLAIIDRAGGQQPMVSADGAVAITYNGEIYNFQTLREELAAAGHRFRTSSDTEVILEAWRAWGPRCVERLRGMFAFAIWDRAGERLFLARDRVGIKPLHYAVLPGGLLAFASELKGLAVHPELGRRVDPRSVEDYFAFGYVPDPRTIYEGVRKLPPGTRLLLERGRPVPEPEQWWEVPFGERRAWASGRASEAALAGELRERMREAVAVRLVSEVPLGAFLSGGVDSSAVVATMAGLQDRAVETCSIAFDDPRFDESGHAARVAAGFGTRHRVRTVAVDDFGLLERLGGIYDEPFADSSALPTYRVCELAKEGVTVCLSGDGGDELLAGYRRYRLHMMEERLRGALPLGVRRRLFGTLGRVYPKADWAPRVLRGKTTFQALARDSVEAYFHTVSILGDELRARLFTPEFRRALQGYRAGDVFRAHAARAQGADPLSLVQYLDFKTYLPGDILTKVDRASMAHALEVRVPLLDHPLLEWAARVPPGLRLRGGEGKYLLKRALEPVLPREILYRSKMGFSVPLARWFRGPLRERIQATVRSPRLRETGWFEPHFLEHLADAHASGRRDYSAPLWSLLVFEGFLAREGGGVESRPGMAAVA